MNMNSKDSVILPRPAGGNPVLFWDHKDSASDAKLRVDVNILYVHERVRPELLAQKLLSETTSKASEQDQRTLFDSSNELSSHDPYISSYVHSDNWNNRLILGDSLLVMASLMACNNLTGKIQAIYFDPPYGINFNKSVKLSNSRKRSAEIHSDDESFPEIQAYRDSWRNGVSGYLNFLRDRLTLARELLADSGSIFVQMGEENVHRVRLILDEIFGSDNFVTTISYRTSSGFPTRAISRVGDYILWYGKDKRVLKYRPLFRPKDPLTGDEHGNYRFIELPDFSRRPMTPEERSGERPLPKGTRIYLPGAMDSQGVQKRSQPIEFRGQTYHPAGSRIWTAQYPVGMERLKKANRIEAIGKNLRYVRYLDDFPYIPLNSSWNDTGAAGFSYDKRYSVQTNPLVVERCLLMSTDPGDLVLDPACGSGVTAFEAERWGRRWIAIDTSRLAISITRDRLLGGKYPYFQTENPSQNPADGLICKKASHVTVKSTGTNEQIDAIWDKYQPVFQKLVTELNALADQNWKDWEIPHLSDAVVKKLQDIPEFIQTLESYWRLFASRQKEIDAAIADNSESETLCDHPFEVPERSRCTSPFTIESLYSNEDAQNTDSSKKSENQKAFEKNILTHLALSGIVLYGKKQRIAFNKLNFIKSKKLSAEGEFTVNQTKVSVGFLIADEFDSVASDVLTQAATEAHKFHKDALFALAFNFDPVETEFLQSLPLPVYPVKISPDMHVSNELNNNQSSACFVLYGCPILDVQHISKTEFQLKLKGVRMYNPLAQTEELQPLESVGAWFIDTNFNGREFNVCQARYPDASLNPYRRWNSRADAARLNQKEWDALTSSVSDVIGNSNRIAVKIVSPAGDESTIIVPIPSSRPSRL
ncbi:MAG: site-specific DNA-methyltransferase [Thermoguttaceae bacterium]|nr:site-specific DNA-methyltransferase [Thermoguttaceae bacterium]